MLKPHLQATEESASREGGKLPKKKVKALDKEEDVFKQHSIRAAATSAAVRKNIPLHTILNTVGWSKDSTLQKYYYKPVEEFSNLMY